MSGQQTTRRVTNQLLPQGNVALTLPYVAKVATGGPDQLDLTFFLSNNSMDQIQSVFVDNWDGSETFFITLQGSGQRIACPAGSQGWFPCMVTFPNSGNITFTGANHLTPVFFLNVPMPEGVWGKNSGQGGGNGIAPLASSVLTGGTAVTVFSPGPSDGAIIVNPFAATESLFVDIVFTAGTTAPGANGTTVELKAGGSFTVPPSFGGVVSVNAVTAGHVFSAYGVG